MSVKQPRTRKFMAHEPDFTIIDAMNRLFPAWFDGESCWDAWRESAGSMSGMRQGSGACCSGVREGDNPAPMRSIASPSHPTGGPLMGVLSLTFGDGLGARKLDMSAVAQESRSGTARDTGKRGLAAAEPQEKRLQQQAGRRRQVTQSIEP